MSRFVLLKRRSEILSLTCLKPAPVAAAFNASELVPAAAAAALYFCVDGIMFGLAPTRSQGKLNNRSRSGLGHACEQRVEGSRT